MSLDILEIKEQNSNIRCFSIKKRIVEIQDRKLYLHNTTQKNIDTRVGV